MRQVRHKVATVAAVLLALGMTQVAVASGSGASASRKGGPRARTVQIAEFGYNDSPDGVAFENGAMLEAKKLGVQVTWFNGNNDPETQYTQIQDAITSGKYQAFWIMPLDGTELLPLVKSAERAGIKVANADYTLGNTQATLVLHHTPGTVTTVGWSVGAATEGLIAEIRKACAAKVGTGRSCTVAFMPGLSNYPADTVRVDMLQKAFGHGPIHLSVMPPGDYDQPTAQKVALTYFGAHPKVDVFGTLGDQMAAGVLTALHQLSIVPGKDIEVIGYGGTKQLVAGVANGSVFADLGLYPTLESELGVKYLVDAVHGEPVPGVVNVLDLPGSPNVLDKAFLKAHPSYRPDWSLTAP